MAREIGYPLPDGDAFTEEMECAIVYYPAKAEYRQALLGSISFLATWRAWQRDTGKRGKDAALAWSNALELTMGCWNMACIETLIENQEFMMEWMATHSLDCCEGTTYGDTTIITTIIIPYVGDPPAFYGETAISDWDDWSQHVCFNAHAWVDLLIENALVLEEGLLAGGIGMGMLAYVLAGVAFIATGGLLAIPVIMLGAASLLTLEGSGIFSAAADDLETARDDIVCALISGLDVGEAIEDAIGSGLAWTTVFSLLDYSTPTAILYEGEGLDSYLPSDTSEACDCEQPPELNGWTVFNTDYKVMDRTETPPQCDTWPGTAWVDFHRPEGSPLVNGTITVRGTCYITGTYSENANCADHGQIVIWIWGCEDATEGPSHGCSVTQYIILNQEGGIPGVVDYAIPFEYTRSMTNAGCFSFAAKQRWTYGDVDVTLHSEINFLEIT